MERVIEQRLHLDADKCEREDGYAVFYVRGKKFFVPEKNWLFGHCSDVTEFEYQTKFNVFYGTKGIKNVEMRLPLDGTTEVIVENREGLTYGEAIEALKRGECIARTEWNGSGMFVFKQVPSKVEYEYVSNMSSLPESVKEKFLERESGPNYQNQMAIVKPDNTVDSWVASSSDTFAEDWIIV